MLTTLELRWFVRGTPANEVEHWFNVDCPGKLLGSPEKREDLYLYTPECDYLNIKLRQGRLEVKWRKAELGILQLGECWEGKAEKWLKWICDDSDQQSMIPANVVEEKAWVGVKKVRSQRHYQGVTYELTQLSVRNEVWWSIALEMFVPEGNRNDSSLGVQVDPHFQEIVSQVSQTYRGPKLECDRSFAYPTWLARLTR
ncbi:hypothetical protein [Allocoleopsis franciscana]|uniref:CYTH domain-containing protein n=1 Tax=Allocoleopsis franciscana PCC 7113 TaxID=1173027 RepID=K9W766_9CYAN|nr:hypothetical protein [Allocoleopsis franciscana]AFZ16220.1 hypothetical protein Mic7113_0290 [Allocoleopsis franciscana PCC 7113]